MRLEHWLRLLNLRFRSLFRRRHVEQELDEELQFHLDRLIAQNIANGFSPEEARRLALVSMGGLEQRKEEVRDTRHMNPIADLVGDLRYSFRMLRRERGFFTFAILTLALGIGVNIAVFSMLDSVLFPRLPYPQPRELVRVFRTVPQSDSWSSTAPDYLAYRDQTRSFSQIAAFVGTNFSLSEQGQLSERIPGLRTTAEYFRVFGVEPALGRTFIPDDDRPGVAPVVILSDRLWRRRFDSDPGIVGRILRVDGQPASVIGVMPASFDNQSMGAPADMWRPIAFTEQQRFDRLSGFLNIVGRLNPHVTTTQADLEIKAIALRMRQEQVNAGAGKESARVESLSQGDADARLWGWLGVSVTFSVLLIACVNLASLQLARTASRAREFAVRKALGGGRIRLIRQSLTESLVLAVIGCVVAIPTARWVAAILYVQFEEAWLPQPLLDWHMLAFAALCAVMSALISGAAPAWIVARTNLNESLKAHQRNASTSRGQRRLHEGLIVAEIMLSFILLAVAISGIASLRDAMQIDRGWNPDGLLSARLSLNSAAYADFVQRSEFLEKLEGRLSSIPGVRHAAVSMTAVGMMAQGFSWSLNYVAIEGRQNERILVESEAASTQFFQTMGLRLKRGRAFAATDRRDHPQVVVINERMAQRFWPNENALGKRIQSLPNGPFMEVVGVVDDVRFPYRPVALPDSDLQIYRPIAQTSGRGITVGLRTAGPPAGMASTLRRAIMEIDPDLPAYDIATGPEIIEQSLRPQSFPSILLIIFAGLGLLLAGVGIAGVISYSVSQRTVEIGIRMALGADRGSVVRLIIKQGSKLISLGAGLGLSGAVAATLVFGSTVPPVKDTAPLAIIGATLALLLVALASCYLPARRASRLDPLTALRSE